MEKTVIELFAGVGGFRVGLNNNNSIDKNGRPTEGMPFKAFEFEKLIDTPWEESSIREDFVDLKLMCLVLKKSMALLVSIRLSFGMLPIKSLMVLLKKCMKNVRI